MANDDKPTVWQNDGHKCPEDERISSRAKAAEDLTLLTFQQSLVCHFSHSEFYAFLFNALHGMQTRSSDDNFVCPSLRLSARLSNAFIVTKRKKKICPDFYTIRKLFSLVFRKQWLVRGEPFSLKFWVNGHWSEIADFEQIFARSASAATSSEKS